VGEWRARIAGLRLAHLEVLGDKLAYPADVEPIGQSGVAVDVPRPLHTAILHGGFSLALLAAFGQVLS